MIDRRSAGALVFSVVGALTSVVGALTSVVGALAHAQGMTPESGHPTQDHSVPKVSSRVTGIGGIFIKAKDPARLRAWYKDHLGIDVQTWGGATFRWADRAGRPIAGKTAWFVGNGKDFAPSTASFMVDYRVADLKVLLAALRAERCDVLEKTEQSEFGQFGWVMDPEGNKVELWQPPDGQ